MRLWCLLLVLLLVGCTAQSPSSNSSQRGAQNQSVGNTSQLDHSPTLGRVLQAGSPEFVCNLFDSRANALNIGGADLGVPLLSGSSLWLIFGDSFVLAANSMKGPSGGAGSSSVIQSTLPFDCSSFSFVTSGSKYYQPLKSSRLPNVDESTVPAGAIVINGTSYIYAMRVTHWSKSNADQTHAYGVLFRQDGSGPFTNVTQWPLDQPFVNAAPLMGQLPNGTQAVFIAASGVYRNSPVYLSYVLPSDIENSSEYHYFIGYDQEGLPLWTSDMKKANPLIDGVYVGELSFVYDGPLKNYMLMFFDHKNHTLDLYNSSTPFGPFSGPLETDPCGLQSTLKPSWMQPGWGGCYGGYIIPDDFGPDGNELYYTLSLWDPYTTMLMKMSLNASSG